MQRKGVGARLFNEIEARALELGLTNITTDASITARPFFERRGFQLVKENGIERDGVELINYAMEKLLI